MKIYVEKSILVVVNLINLRRKIDISLGKTEKFALVYRKLILMMIFKIKIFPTVILFGKPYFYIDIKTKLFRILLHKLGFNYIKKRRFQGIV